MKYNVQSTTISSSHYNTTITARSHSITADEPVESGGTDTSFNPDELLAASLASCTSITLRMYADRKNWLVGDISVDVTIERDKANETTRFNKQIKFSNALTDEQRHRLLDIAEKCPVEQMLTGTVLIASSIV